MAYLPDTVPGPEPSFDDARFWEFCAKDELRFQRCLGCGRFRYPPRPACEHCRSFESEWVVPPDEAELFSFTIVHYAAHPGVAAALPYNVAIVRYPSCDDVRVISNVIDARPDELSIGMPLSLIFETAGNGARLPRYRRKDGAR